MKRENKSSDRVLFIDIARGISILLMIAGHVLTNGIKRNIIFSFHMPLFIIASGYFHKDRSLKEEIKTLFLKLLLPTTIIVFAVFMISNVPKIGFEKSIVEVLKVITVCWSHKSKIDYSFASVDVLWFIYLLIGIRLLFSINKKVSKDNDILLSVIIIIETLIGYIVGIKGYWLPWSIDISFACMLFYFIGYILKKYNVLEKILSNYKILLPILLIWVVGIKYSWIEIAVRSYPHGLWSYITAISGSIIILKLSQYIEKIKYISNALAWCGKNSLYILFGHHIERGLIVYNLSIANASLLKAALISIKSVFSILFAIIYSYIMKALKHIGGKK